MTKTNDVKLTAEQQLDVLWALLSERGVMAGVSADREPGEDQDLSLWPTSQTVVLKGQTRFTGTREEIIEQLCARQVAARLQT